jgi:hypothetical protein
MDTHQRIAYLNAAPFPRSSAKAPASIGAVSIGAVSIHAVSIQTAFRSTIAGATLRRSGRGDMALR